MSKVTVFLALALVGCSRVPIQGVCGSGTVLCPESVTVCIQEQPMPAGVATFPLNHAHHKICCGSDGKTLISPPVECAEGDNVWPARGAKCYESDRGSGITLTDIW